MILTDNRPLKPVRRTNSELASLAAMLPVMLDAFESFNNIWRSLGNCDLAVIYPKAITLDPIDEIL